MKFGFNRNQSNPQSSNILKEIGEAKKLYVCVMGNSIMVHSIKHNSKTIKIPIISNYPEAFIKAGFSGLKEENLISGDIAYILSIMYDNQPMIFYMSKYGGETVVETEQIVQYMNYNMKMDIRFMIEHGEKEKDILFQSALKELAESNELYIGITNNHILSTNFEQNGKRIDTPIISSSKEAFKFVTCTDCNNAQIEFFSGDIIDILRKLKETPSKFYYLSKCVVVKTEEILQHVNDNRKNDLTSLIGHHQDGTRDITAKYVLDEIVESEKLYIGTINGYPISYPVDNNGVTIQIPVVSNFPEVFFGNETLDKEKIELITGDISYFLRNLKGIQLSKIYYISKNIDSNSGIIVDIDKIKQHVKDNVLKKILDVETLYVGMIEGMIPITMNINYNGKTFRLPVVSVTQKTFNDVKTKSPMSINVVSGSIAYILSIYNEIPNGIFYISDENNPEFGTSIDTRLIMQYMPTQLRELMPEYKKDYTENLMKFIFKEIVKAEKLYMGFIDGNVIIRDFNNSGESIPLPVISSKPEAFNILAREKNQEEHLKIMSGDIDFFLSKMKNFSQFYYILKHSDLNVGQFAIKIIDVEKINQYINNHLDQKSKTQRYLKELDFLSKELEESKKDV